MQRVLVFLTFLAACGGGPKITSAPTAQASAGSGFDGERFFPLEEGKIYSYATREGTDTGMLVAKVHRIDKTHGELRISNATKRFVFAPEGVAYDGGAFILKSPIAVGTSWPGEHGGITRIDVVDAAVTVPAGSYASCVRTIEEGGRTPGAHYETTYCPGVGMVLLVVAAGGSEARAELKSYAAPVAF